MTASAGLTERRVAGLDVDELLRSADIALTWAKSDGRNRWRRFDPVRNAADTARWSLAAELPAAVRDGALEVHYQPMVGLADGRLHAVEALVRWKHPRHGLLLPGRFIAAAEETGLVVPLGRQVLAAACAEAASWTALTPDPPLISVNVAAGQLRDPGLVADVVDILDATGLPPERLQLELLETAVIQPGGRGADHAAGARRRRAADRGGRLRHRPGRTTRTCGGCRCTRSSWPPSSSPASADRTATRSTSTSRPASSTSATRSG